MRVYRPTDNNITGEYTDIHKAYDFAGLNVPDPIRAGANGIVVERADTYNTNWQANTANDPFKPATGTRKLLTQDYGNYIKIRHDDGTFELHAHLKQGSSLNVNTRVSVGQTIARIGNTGNSSGPHVHSEYRNTFNQNVPVEFYTEGGVGMANMYKGYDLANPESMKVAVDILVRVQAGEFVDKPKYDALEKEAIELRKRPASCPPIDLKAEALKKALKEFLS